MEGLLPSRLLHSNSSLIFDRNLSYLQSFFAQDLYWRVISCKRSHCHLQHSNNSKRTSFAEASFFRSSLTGERKVLTLIRDFSTRFLVEGFLVLVRRDRKDRFVGREERVGVELQVGFDCDGMGR